MRNAEIDQFYSELCDLVLQYSGECDILLVVGDDNSHDEDKSCATARRAYKRLEEIRAELGGHGVAGVDAAVGSAEAAPPGAPTRDTRG